MVEENQKVMVAALLKALKFLASKATPIIAKGTAKTVKTGANLGKLGANLDTPSLNVGNSKRNIRALLKHNKGAGIYVEQGLDKTLASALAKDLSLHNQDYVLEKANDGQYKLTVLSANKTLVDELKNRCMNKAYKPKKIKIAKLDIFKKLAQKEIAKSIERKQERTLPQKHKEVSIR